MLENISLDKKIYFLSKLDKKYEMKSSFEFLFKKGLFSKVLGVSYLAADLFAPNYVDLLIKKSMTPCKSRITIDWLNFACKKKKITENWSCYYSGEKLLGAYYKSEWLEEYFETNDLDRNLIKNFLYRDSNIISINSEYLFDWRKNDISLEEIVIPAKKLYSDRVIKDKQINVFVGSSGSGKTSTALSNCKDHEKVVIVSGGHALYHIDKVLSTFSPDVLIFDDVEIAILKSTNLLISAIDRIRLTKTKLFVTVMVDEAFALKPGSLYLPGLRPGRVDQIIYFESMPNNAKEELLKKNNIEITDIAKTNGFTYAYMLELINLIKEENMSYDDATYRLSLFIPVIPENKEKKENDQLS